MGNANLSRNDRLRVVVAITVGAALVVEDSPSQGGRPLLQWSRRGLSFGGWSKDAAVAAFWWQGSGLDAAAADGRNTADRTTAVVKRVGASNAPPTHATRAAFTTLAAMVLLLRHWRVMVLVVSTRIVASTVNNGCIVVVQCLLMFYALAHKSVKYLQINGRPTESCKV